MKPYLTHITCTGIDAFTDIVALLRLQQKHPLIEFGVLVAGEKKDSNRFPPRGYISGLRDRGLNLSLHLCGEPALQAACGNWTPVKDILKEDLEIFRRIQLNIAGSKSLAQRLPKELSVTVPADIDEIIIQQKDAAHCDLYLQAKEHEPALSVLLDASGGRGVFSQPQPLGRKHKTGFAGGLNPDNVAAVVTAILDSDDTEVFWIDAETGLRNEADHFSITLADAYATAAENAITK